MALAQPLSVDAFAAKVAAIEERSLAELYDATRRTGAWAQAAGTYRSIAEQVGPVPARPAAASAPPVADKKAAAPSSALASESGAPAAGPAGPAREVTAIPPPPPSFVAQPPVEATETLTCAELPPGPQVGNYSIWLARVAETAFEAAAENVDIEFTVPVPPLFVVVLVVPNPLTIALRALHLAAQLTVLTLTYLRDRYWDCGGTDLLAAGPAMENTAIQTYGLLSQANGTLNTVNEGLIVVSDQVQFVTTSAEQILKLRIQQALALPASNTANVAYLLPASEGGYLDASPVGVKSVVTDMLAAARAARLPVRAAVTIYVAQANLALNMKNYAGAYRYFQQAYQALGNQPSG